jgi:hypothetical protein
MQHGSGYAFDFPNLPLMKRLFIPATLLIACYSLSAQVRLDENRMVFEADNPSVALWNLSDSFFTPAIPDIEFVDTHLRAYFKKNASETANYDYSKYFRQYCGLIINGEKIVFVNAACSKEEKFTQVLLPYRGEGDCYFRTNVNLKDGKVIDFKFNE